MTLFSLPRLHHSLLICPTSCRLLRQFRHHPSLRRRERPQLGLVHAAMISATDMSNHAPLSCEDESRANPVPPGESTNTSGDIEMRSVTIEPKAQLPALIQPSLARAYPDVEMHAVDPHCEGPIQVCSSLCPFLPVCIRYVTELT